MSRISTGVSAWNVTGFCRCVSLECHGFLPVCQLGMSLVSAGVSTYSATVSAGLSAWNVKVSFYTYAEGAIQVLRNADGGGGGGVRFSGKKRYEGVIFNVISVTMGWVGVQFPGK